MLQIQNITKHYRTGNLVQEALGGVSLCLRDNEFVSILGPSGSGKTTLLNIIGGLDRYDTGDLIINGVSTKDYRDRDWDAYRNHSIGFVFQSYNLIPHQTILANVELALTIGGISPGERKNRARQALEKVGLGEQCHKRPNQLSGGQMQRVAIARALVNDPDILLADEPTGALDTQTSIQVIELLKEVAKDRLVVMVTHNPELAEQYSTRIVKLRDGKIISDSDPYTPLREEKPRSQRLGKAKMGFLTALSLSFNNLRTKIGRTVLTAFAGSIGIIGIALILALSTGVNTYIADIQKQTMASYPITISDQTVDMSAMMNVRAEIIGAQQAPVDPSRRGVYSDSSSLEISNMMVSNITENNLTVFRQYLEDPSSEIHQYLGENGLVYHYDTSFRVYTQDAAGAWRDTDTDPDENSQVSSPLFQQMQTMMGTSAGSAGNFTQLMPGPGGTGISQVVMDSYEILSGHWPQEKNQVVLMVDRNNAVDTLALYQLGLMTQEEYEEICRQVEAEEDTREQQLDYAQVCGHTFYLVPACDGYVQGEDGIFHQLEGTAQDFGELGMELEICGIVRPTEDQAGMLSIAVVGYTAELTDAIIRYTNESPVILAQEAVRDVNVLTGIAFQAKEDSQKAEDAASYIRGMSEADKVSLFTMIQYQSAQNAAAQQPDAAQQMGGYSQMGGAQQPMDQSAMAAAMDQWLDADPDQEVLLAVYDRYLGDASYEENMTAFGKVSYDAPASISIYTDSFEGKEAVALCIAAYNEKAQEDDQITYVDYVQMMTASLTSIIDVISYVLIAFVAVSLVVSCIMIGIITHISVMERTKEIGILRALGASKANVSQVFNAETLIIGLCAGAMGVGITIALTFPINGLLENLLGTADMTAQLPMTAAVILVGVSVVITMLGGLMPAKKAAKMDPVAALRTE